MSSRLQGQHRSPVKVLILIAAGFLIAGLVIAGNVWVLLHGVVLHWDANGWRVMSSEAAKNHRLHMMVAADISTLKLTLNRYKSITGIYPRTEHGLGALITQQAEPYMGRRTLLNSVPKDPWGSHYIYLCPGEVHPDTYDLYSPGPDRIPNTADDDWGNMDLTSR
jgi:type II secretion system protein G